MAILVLSLNISMKLRFKIVNSFREKVGFRYYLVYVSTKNMSKTYAICMQLIHICFIFTLQRRFENMCNLSLVKEFLYRTKEYVHTQQITIVLVMCNMHEDEYKVARFSIRNLPLNAVIYFSRLLLYYCRYNTTYMPVNTSL